MRAQLDLEELLATRLLVQGNSGSGKSHLLRRLLEQSASLVQQAVIDPEGNFLGIRQGEGNYDLLDRVIEAMIERTKDLRMGSPMDPETQVGPVISQLFIILRAVNRARPR